MQVKNNPQNEIGRKIARKTWKNKSKYKKLNYSYVKYDFIWILETAELYATHSEAMIVSCRPQFLAFDH